MTETNQRFTANSIQLRELKPDSTNLEDAMFALRANSLLGNTLRNPVDWELERVVAAIGKNSLLGAANIVMGPGRVAYLRGIVTTPEVRHNGIGTILMHHLIEQAAHDEYETIQIFLDGHDPNRGSDNDPRRFFARFGFVAIPQAEGDPHGERLLLSLPAIKSTDN